RQTKVPSFRGVTTCERICKEKPLDALRCLSMYVEGNLPSHRQTSESKRPDVKGIHQREAVRRKRFKPCFTIDGQRTLAVTAQVRSDDAVPAAQGIHLRRPHAPVEWMPVNQQHVSHTGSTAAGVSIAIDKSAVTNPARARKRNKWKKFARAS